MQDAGFQVFTQFMRHLSLLVTHIISLGRNVLITLYPKGTDRDLSFMLDPEYWFRCLMLESLTVMGVDSAESRERRAPWGVMKFLKAGVKKRQKAVSFELDKLMIWLPAPCAIAIAKDMATTSSYTSTSYKVERGCADPSSDRRFSFYSVKLTTGLMHFGFDFSTLKIFQMIRSLQHVEPFRIHDDNPEPVWVWTDGTA